MSKLCLRCYEMWRSHAKLQADWFRLDLFEHWRCAWNFQPQRIRYDFCKVEWLCHVLFRSYWQPLVLLACWWFRGRSFLIEAQIKFSVQRLNTHWVLVSSIHMKHPESIRDITVSLNMFQSVLENVLVWKVILHLCQHGMGRSLSGPSCASGFMALPEETRYSFLYFSKAIDVAKSLACHWHVDISWSMACSSIPLVSFGSFLIICRSHWRPTDSTCC